jgi:hypothetical protein
VVDLPGLEPGTSSLSGIEGSALCGAAFSQIAGERQGRRDAFLQSTRISHGRAAGAVGAVWEPPVAGKVMGLPGGRGSPIEWWTWAVWLNAEATTGAAAKRCELSGSLDVVSLPLGSVWHDPAA